MADEKLKNKRWKMDDFGSRKSNLFILQT